ncbi:MAG: hypothetical protein JO083_09845 [Candidatus Eremiobacteraeota bacterium]|nr:hypothetical protein [Candidatus Eremiobacteraeota bacterium]MBV8370807.1 hypothetical protein [Candidatus Eremiobacteraeota bacterium]
MNVAIDALRLRFRNAAGHEHRIEPLTRRALALLAARLQAADEPLPANAQAARTIAVGGIAFDRLGDEEAASAIADTVATSLRAISANGAEGAAWES